MSWFGWSFPSFNCQNADHLDTAPPRPAKSRASAKQTTAGTTSPSPTVTSTETPTPSPPVSPPNDSTADDSEVRLYISQMIAHIIQTSIEAACAPPSAADEQPGALEPNAEAASLQQETTVVVPGSADPTASACNVWLNRYAEGTHERRESQMSEAELRSAAETFITVPTVVTPHSLHLTPAKECDSQEIPLPATVDGGVTSDDAGIKSIIERAERLPTVIEESTTQADSSLMQSVSDITPRLRRRKSVCAVQTSANDHRHGADENGENIHPNVQRRTPKSTGKHILTAVVVSDSPLSTIKEGVDVNNESPRSQQVQSSAETDNYDWRNATELVSYRTEQSAWMGRPRAVPFNQTEDKSETNMIAPPTPKETASPKNTEDLLTMSDEKSKSTSAEESKGADVKAAEQISAVLHTLTLLRSGLDRLQLDVAQLATRPTALTADNVTLAKTTPEHVVSTVTPSVSSPKLPRFATKSSDTTDELRVTLTNSTSTQTTPKLATSHRRSVTHATTSPISDFQPLRHTIQHEAPTETALTAALAPSLAVINQTLQQLTDHSAHSILSPRRLLSPSAFTKHSRLPVTPAETTYTHHSVMTMQTTKPTQTSSFYDASVSTLALITPFLTISDMTQFSQTCRYWNDACQEPAMWENSEHNLILSKGLLTDMTTAEADEDGRLCRLVANVPYLRSLYITFTHLSSNGLLFLLRLNWLKELSLTEQHDELNLTATEYNYTQTSSLKHKMKNAHYYHHYSTDKKENNHHQNNNNNINNASSFIHGLSKLLTYLPSLQELEFVNLHHNKVTEDLFKAIGKCKNLKSLSFKSIHLPLKLGGKGGEMNENKSLPSSSAWMTTTPTISSKLNQKNNILKPLNTLSSSSTSCITDIQPAYHYFKYIRHLPLTFLRLERCGLNESIFEMIGNTFLSLITLDLSNNELLTGDHLFYLKNCLYLNHLKMYKLTDTGLFYLKKYFSSNINTLDIHNADLWTALGWKYINEITSLTNVTVPTNVWEEQRKSALATWNTQRVQ